MGNCTPDQDSFFFCNMIGKRENTSSQVLFEERDHQSNCPSNQSRVATAKWPTIRVAIDARHNRKPIANNTLSYKT